MKIGKSPLDPREEARASQKRGTFARRRTVFLFVTAGAVTLLAFTTRFWFLALPTLFGAIEANRELIGAFADLSTIATGVMLLIGVTLAYLGFRNLRPNNSRQHAQQSVATDRGGHDATVGDANRDPGDRSDVEAVTSGPSASVRAITELREGFDRFQRERPRKGLDRMPRHGALEVAAVTEGSEAPIGYPTEQTKT